MNKADDVIQEFKNEMDKYDGENYPPGMQGAIIGTLEKACGGKDNRKLVLKLLTGHTSSKDLHPAQWYALYKLVLPYKPEGGKWGSGNPELEYLCNCLLSKTVDQSGQTKFEFPEFEELKDVAIGLNQPLAVDDFEDKEIPF